jgi:hypothetical protein
MRIPAAIAAASFIAAIGAAAAAGAGEAIYRDKSELDDAGIARQIAEALADARIGGVRVESTNGTVMLTGVVKDGEAVRSAVAAARAVPGVREIDNRLVPAPRPRIETD